METIEVLAPRLAVGHAAALRQIRRMRNTLELSEQLCLAVGGKQDLKLAELPQGPCRRHATDPSLVAAQPSKEVLQVEIVGGEGRNIVAVQELRPPGPPQPTPGAEQGRLRGLLTQRGGAGG